ncbi:hypothetical protein [Microlunatus sp. GCM10028923]|uniref:hypothetical protein n=1 Tax=Microlunatus sp. GCM10028923 TaxID=3273400 RepID=UPI0036078DC0
MERSERDKPEQTDAAGGLDQITLPPPPSQEQRARIFAEAAAEVRADNEQHPRRNLDPPDDAEAPERDKWDDSETTGTQIDELKNEGHGPQRHVEITDDGRKGRLGTAAHDENGDVMYRPDGHVKKQRGSQIDPETGTPTDAMNGGLHFCGPYACKFNDPADYCRADEELRRRAVDTGELNQEARASDLFPGQHPNDLFDGFYQDPNQPEDNDGKPRFKSVDFTDCTIKSFYVESDDGALNLTTMYPDPERGRNG